ncbi:hypothetical protein HDE80_000654 [Rhodanobacter sp. A1T4]|nr:hypothetical protein [Rhodanobacter sp. A1T4]
MDETGHDRAGGSDHAKNCVRRGEELAKKALTVPEAEAPPSPKGTATP